MTLSRLATAFLTTVMEVQQAPKRRRPSGYLKLRRMAGSSTSTP